MKMKNGSLKCNKNIIFVWYFTIIQLFFRYKKMYYIEGVVTLSNFSFKSLQSLLVQTEIRQFKQLPNSLNIWWTNQTCSTTCLNCKIFIWNRSIGQVSNECEVLFLGCKCTISGKCCDPKWGSRFVLPTILLISLKRQRMK